MRAAIGETDRRRAIQLAYNEEHGITAATIVKGISDIAEFLQAEGKTPQGPAALASAARAKAEDMSLTELEQTIIELEEEMLAAADDLRFEYAARLRDEIRELRRELVAMRGVRGAGFLSRASTRPRSDGVAGARPGSGASTSWATCRRAEAGRDGSPMRASPRSSAVRDAAVAPGSSAAHAALAGEARADLGLAVHVLDFSELRAEGEGFSIEVGGARSHPFAIADDLYRRLVRDALALLLPAALGDRHRREPGPGYGRRRATPTTRVAAWTGPDAERLYPGWRARAASTSRAAGTTRRLRQVRDQRRDRACGSCCDGRAASPSRTRSAWWAGPRRCCSRSAAGSSTGCCGCRCPPGTAGRHGVPPRARHRVVTAARLAARGPDDAGAAPPSTAATLHLAAVAAHGARVLRGDARVRPPAARRGPSRPRGRAPARRCWSPRTTRAASAAARTATTTSTTTATGRPPSCGWPRATTVPRRAQACAAHTGDVFDLAGFDFEPRGRARPRSTSLCTASALPDHDRVLASVAAAADRLLALQADQPWGQPYAPRGRAGTGARTGGSSTTSSCSSVAHALTRRAPVPRRRRRRHRLPAGPQRARAELRHRLRHRRHPPPAHPPVRARPRSALPPPPPGALAGGANSQAAPGLPVRPAPGRAAAAALLPRRAHVGDHQRRLHPLERPARLDAPPFYAL